MIKSLNRPNFKRKIHIKGNCLFLVGPIGTFFSRLSNYLEVNGISTYKISFPLYEFGFRKSKRIYYSKSIYEFKELLIKTLIEKNIKHIFMYGNLLIPHRYALEVVEDFKKKGIEIYTHIFELGYIRPDFVTLEDKNINYKSSFILNKDFYFNQEPYTLLPIPKRYSRFRVRKIWKAITFINHSFTNYKIVESEHKLQPKPIFIWFQLKGFLLKYYFGLSEYKLKKRCFNKQFFFIVIIQVSSDSQLTKGSRFKSNEEFIYKVIKDFARAKLDNVNLIFKHHPRDRGYINYNYFVKKISDKFCIGNKVFYIHDFSLTKIFTNPKCKGTVLINSTVGYQSLYHSIPLKALGISAYNINGLTHHGSLISFFKKPNFVDKLLFRKFYKYIIENSQINSNFDGFFPFQNVFICSKK